jgi:hypothetical protein
MRVVGNLRVDGRFPTIHRQAVTANTTWTDDSVTVLGVETLAANLTVTLGDLSNDFEEDVAVSIKDETGDANPTDRLITIAPSGGATIDGEVNVALTAAYESLTIYSVRGSNKWLII